MKFNYKKSLGQNFLMDKNKINQIIESIEVRENDLIVEIGPGAGAITKELIKKNCDVLCFEIDIRLKDILSKIDSDKLEIVYQDFLTINLSDYINYSKYKKIIFVGNLPYYITTAIINKIIDYNHADEIVIMVQKEVAERFMAKPNSKKYNSLSVFLQYHFNIFSRIFKFYNSFDIKIKSSIVKLSALYVKSLFIFFKIFSILIKS